jgi:hypothetical protein
MMTSPPARKCIGFLSTAVLLLLACGCNSRQLRFTTMRLSETIPDLQERQVIHNFARVAANPGAIPYYTVINSGTANITDNAAGGIYSLFLSPSAFTTANLEGTTSRSVTGNWTLNPMSNPDRLRAMRAAYHIALGADDIDPLDAKKLDAILKDQKDLVIPRGWICAGTRHQVPRGACIVSHCGKTYVWVVPGHSRDFADFSLLMLNIATWVPPYAKERAKAAGVPGVRALPGEEDEQQPGIQMRMYEDSTGFNRGLFFVPR